MLLSKLIAKQREIDLPDELFAARLGYCRMWWNQVKNKRQPLSKGMAIRAMNAFPDLTGSCIQHLQEDGK